MALQAQPLRLAQPVLLVGVDGRLEGPGGVVRVLVVLGGVLPSVILIHVRGLLGGIELF